MNSATLHLLASAVRLVGAVAVIILIIIAIYALREARSGLYYVVREKARSRGLRFMLVALLVVPVTLGLAAYVDHVAGSPTMVVSATVTPTFTRTAQPVRPTVTVTATPEAPTDTPQPRPSATPLPVPTATASPTRIPPTDLPPTLLTPIPSAVAAAENASFGPIQLGASFINRQLGGIGNAFPLDTPIIHATFLVRNMNRNAIWTPAWYRDGKYVDGAPLLWTDVPNINGHVFYGSPGGFRPGKWELRLYIEDRLQSKAAFTILAATSTPTITPTVTATATAVR